MTWIALLVLPVLAQPTADPDAQAWRMLRSGGPRYAATHFRGVLEDDPDNVKARGGLAAALIAMGLCGRAEEHLDGLRPTEGWISDVAAAEGACAGRRDDFATAMAAYEEAVDLDPESLSAWYRLVLTAGAYGEGEALEEALVQLDDSPRRPHLLEIARATLAQEWGRSDVDWELFDLRRELDDYADNEAAWSRYWLIDGKEWLRLGAPEIAIDSLQKAREGRWRDEFSGAWLGEAHRRAGLMPRSSTVWASGVLSRSRQPIVRLLRVFFLVDSGDLAEAERVFGLVRSGEFPAEYAAAGWYLARAKGEDETVWRLAYDSAKHPEAVDLEGWLPRD